MSETLDERYLYTVNPKRVIRNLNENIPMLRISKSLYLTKEEVLKCLDFGSVYRRFSNYGKLEKVTKYDIDRVHRSNYISAEDWKKIQEKSGNIENLNVNGNEEVKPELGRGKTKPILYYIDEEEKVIPIEVNNTEEAAKAPVEDTAAETSGYVEEVKDEPEELQVTTTVYPDDGTTVTIDMSENNDSNEEVAFINDSVEDTEEIDESEEEDDVEENNIEASEEESKTEQRVVVNYNGGKKKKHKH